ncbi:hypothetical protein B0T26DRAFT_740751 [Lasiosphaeria miniovina]|uniref:F-box domain-containing protein n=1 Tax=Lasiosphaeria miniovina TaxID=1954250 RepID=A0AA40AK16_9PEZI|nr:uncharacterized protein B0T26DRAFT_740751 [Lasiosphaeria miniovina]KAK0717281.1 hypothetical protein B0T26DRAFT_740751 [Lasiosphaeria miniovina]
MPILAHCTPRWIGSATLYQFRDEQANAIARVARYHEAATDRSVIWSPASEQDGVRQSLETSFPRTSNPGILLGFLGSMPLELLHNVFLRLDLDSLFKLRQTNLRSRQAELCTENCAPCGQFGGFMSLPTWTRCCYRCMQLGTEAQVLLCRSKESPGLAPFEAVRGPAQLAELAQKSRRTPVSFFHALPARHNFMGACALPYYYARRHGRARHVVCWVPARFFEQEFVGDNLEKCERKAGEKIFSQAGFLEYFRSCEHAQLLWESSGEGGHDLA